MEQSDSETNNFVGNEIMCNTIKCFGSTAELMRPKKRVKAENLSTITIGYIKDKHPDTTEEDQSFQVFFDS